MTTRTDRIIGTLQLRIKKQVKSYLEERGAKRMIVKSKGER